MNTLAELRWESNFDPIQFPSTPSTLLIPARLVKLMKKRMGNKRLSMSQYVEFLLQTFGSRVGINNSKPVYSLKRRYQSKGQSMRRVSFRPRNGDWQQLGMLADALRVSRCYLVVLFIKLDCGQFAGKDKKFLIMGKAPKGHVKSVQIVSKLFFEPHGYRNVLQFAHAAEEPPS